MSTFNPQDVFTKFQEKNEEGFFSSMKLGYEKLCYFNAIFLDKCLTKFPDLHELYKKYEFQSKCLDSSFDGCLLRSNKEWKSAHQSQFEDPKAKQVVGFSLHLLSLIHFSSSSSFVDEKNLTNEFQTFLSCVIPASTASAFSDSLSLLKKVFVFRIACVTFAYVYLQTKNKILHDRFYQSIKYLLLLT